MSTSTDIEVMSLEEFEFAKPCDGMVRGLPCQQEAKWAVWLKHNAARCPYDVYLCDEHKENAIKVWEHMLVCPAHGCTRCNVKFSGQLSDYIRAVEI